MPRQIGPWTRDKLKVLREYLPGYLQAATRARERIYIDGFAGPGVNVLKTTGEEVEGSPLIALGARARNATAFSRLYFIEQSAVLAAQLRKRVEEAGGSSRATVICGDVNIELPSIVKGLPTQSPIFVFLDPQGIDPRWETIEAIAPWRTELLTCPRKLVQS